MEIIHTVSWMKQVAREARQKEHILGLVPTMGALHDGHVSLIREAQKQCSPVAVSIFVNPKQFGPSEDFKKYPRFFEADRELLEKLGVNYLFAPSPEEIYPRDFRTAVLVEGLSDKLEGKSRSNHFRGVTTVVLKLFEIVQPRFAFFGRKDAQQVVILERMVRDLNLDVEIVTCPIVREPDGLALSSRNVYLQPDERRSALALSRSLQTAKSEILAGERNPAVILAKVRNAIATEPRVDLDYAEIVDAETLEPVMTLALRPSYLLIAARIGSTRLIDNARIDPDGDGGFLIAV
jgi:pantoate--beta-alanine ligase